MAERSDDHIGPGREHQEPNEGLQRAPHRVGYGLALQQEAEQRDQRD